MRSLFLVTIFALQVFAKTAVVEVPRTVRVSGGFMFRDNVTHDFGGTLNLISKDATRTHHQGIVLVEAFTHDNKAAEKRMNLLALTKKGRSHLEFALFQRSSLFQNDFMYEFLFEMPKLIPDAGITIKGQVTKYEQNYCTPWTSEMCYRLIETGPADITVSY